MDSSIPEQFTEVYQEIKELVMAAKDAKEEEAYKLAKNHFLDAASKSLTIAKSLEEGEKVTFRNIARILVDNAKEMQMLIEIEKNPLPPIPGTERKNKIEKPAGIFSKKNDPVLLQLMIIQESGLPMFTFTSEVLPEDVQMKINDVLFSGAITAVNSLIAEVLSKPIQSIKIEDGNITLRFLNTLTFVIFSKGDPELLEDNIEKFSNTFCTDIFPRFQSDIQKGLGMNNNQEIIDLVDTCFKLK